MEEEEEHQVLMERQVIEFDFCSTEEYTVVSTTIHNNRMSKRPRVERLHDQEEVQQLRDTFREEAIVGFLNSTVLPSLMGKDDEDELMLRDLVKRWADFKTLVIHQSWIFVSTKDILLPDNKIDAPIFNEEWLACFRDLVYAQVRLKARDAVITEIGKEREGEEIDRSLLKNVVDIFVEIGRTSMEQYEEDFEVFMLQDSTDYYSQKALSWIGEDSCPVYMLKFEECLRKERERVSHYLHSSTEPKLVEIVQNELLVTYANQLFEKEHSGCRALLRDVRVEDLSRMYRLYHEITNGLDPIANIFKQHITDEVMVFIKQAEDGAASNQAATSSVVQEQALIREILDLHDRHMVYVRGCFSNDFLFDKAWMEAFEEIFKKTVSGSLFAELLATFCHNILKKGRSEEWSDEAAMEETFEKVVKLVTYFSDKDLFAEFYRKKLARRLLFNRSADVERERRILSKLKLLYGAPFTSKMEVMLNDVMLARENQASFQEYLGNEPEAYTGVDLTVTVLSSFYWPSYKTFYLNPPAEMVRCVEVFETFYETQRKKRKLTSLGSCHINANFEQNSFELIVSTHQAAVLLLFNSADRLEYSEIMEQLNSSRDDDLMRCLHSLSCAKYKILTKEPDTRTISKNDTFAFNSQFTNKTRRIRIPLPPVHERKRVVEDVCNDRRHAIDAAIVRIMKSRKVLGHQQLVSECIEQLSRVFKPDVKAIKKRIADLVVREYLEIDAGIPNLLRYLE